MDLSQEARILLQEIIGNENTPNYWHERFSNLEKQDDSILRGCFKELTDAGMIKTSWADNYPFVINILKDGYLYAEGDNNNLMSKFEKELTSLLERGNEITPQRYKNNVHEYKEYGDAWINDFEIFYNKYLKNHIFSSRINRILFHRQPSAFKDLRSILASISKDQDFIKGVAEMETTTVQTKKSETFTQYDVFLSHANKDKIDIVDNLNSSLERLGVKIFYDKKTLEWGDKWKDRILDGVNRSEFAIIVISKNFFDREWTEKELNELLNRQNREGQKIILPIVHNITNDDLRRKYPSIADIQTIDSKEYTCDQIALLFARQMIKRLRV